MIAVMPTCETCGNDYDKVFQVVVQCESHTFDSFECAIHALAPTCAHCEIKIIGDGLEKMARFSAAISAPRLSFNGDEHFVFAQDNVFVAPPWTPYSLVSASECVLFS